MRSYATAVLCTLLLPLASAKCYKDTITTANTQFANDHIEDTAKFLQGTLVSGQERGTCVSDIATGNQWYFGLRNKTSKQVQVNKEDIATYLQQEVNGCNKNGGYSKHGDVEYNADPGNGICYDAIYIGTHPRRRNVGTQHAKVIFVPISGPVPSRPVE